MNKSALRKKFIKIRNAILPAYREDAMEQAAKHFEQLPQLKPNLNIACYLPTKYEFDSAALIAYIWKIKSFCYLPVLTGKSDKILEFVRYDYGTALKPNRLSILEPATRDQKIAANKLDIVITPLVAFDLEGHRLGTGGGFYDTTFSFLHEHYIAKPFFLGLAFAAQQADLIPNDPWDINLDAVLTEKGIIRPFM